MFTTIRVLNKDIRLFVVTARTEAARLRVEARKYRDKGNGRHAATLDDEADELEAAVARLNDAQVNPVPRVATQA